MFMNETFKYLTVFLYHVKTYIYTEYFSFQIHLKANASDVIRKDKQV